jgi:hypothetical protein
VVLGERADGGDSGEREKPFEAQGKRARRTRDGLRPGPERAPEKLGVGRETEPKMSFNYQRTGYHDSYLVSRITM